MMNKVSKLYEINFDFHINKNAQLKHLCYLSMLIPIILTDNPIYYIRVSQTHGEESRYDKLQNMDALQSWEDFLKEAKHQTDNFHITLILLEQNFDLSQHNIVQGLVVNVFINVLNGDKRSRLKVTLKHERLWRCEDILIIWVIVLQLLIFLMCA